MGSNPIGVAMEEQLEKININGLGDTLYYLFKMIGLTKLVNHLYDGEGCGCNSRRAWLNKKFPY